MLNWAFTHTQIYTPFGAGVPMSIGTEKEWRHSVKENADPTPQTPARTNLNLLFPWPAAAPWLGWHAVLQAGASHRHQPGRPAPGCLTYGLFCRSCTSQPALTLWHSPAELTSVLQLESRFKIAPAPLPVAFILHPTSPRNGEGLAPQWTEICGGAPLPTPLCALHRFWQRYLSLYPSVSWSQVQT